MVHAVFNKLTQTDEKENVAMLSIVKFNDFTLAHQMTFGKSNLFIKSYVYQPTKDEAVPRDIKDWEKLILKSCMKEIRDNFEAFWCDGTGGSDEQLLLPMWLAKYGTSESTKHFLVQSPF